MSSKTTPTPTEITFSEAYGELKRITSKLNNEDVEADELVELLRRGKGLEAVLREHLSNIEQEVTAIENGDGITPFRIVPAKGDHQASPSADAPSDTSDFVVDAGGSEPAGSGDDIPF